MACPNCESLTEQNHELIAILNRVLFERMLGDIEEYLADVG